MITFLTRRLTVVGATPLPVYPPINGKRVRIVNATADDLQVANTDNQNEYFILAAGDDYEITLTTDRFDTATIAFYLNAAVSGTVVVLWL